MLLHRPLVPHNTTQFSQPQLVWEESDCPLCGRDEASLLTEAADPIPEKGPGYHFAVVRCRHCDMIYTNPRPTAESLTAFYPSHYAPHVLRQKARINRMPFAILEQDFWPAVPRAARPDPLADSRTATRFWLWRRKLSERNGRPWVAGHRSRYFIPGGSLNPRQPGFRSNRWHLTASGTFAWFF